jgi:hypothetical protein
MFFPSCLCKHKILRLLLPASASGFCFRLLLPASTSGFYFRLLLPASASGFYFRLLLPASTSGFCFRLLLPASASGFYFRLLLPASASGFCFRLLLPASTFVSDSQSVFQVAPVTEQKSSATIPKNAIKHTVCATHTMQSVGSASSLSMRLGARRPVPISSRRVKTLLIMSEYPPAHC